MVGYNYCSDTKIFTIVKMSYNKWCMIKVTPLIDLYESYVALIVIDHLNKL